MSRKSKISFGVCVAVASGLTGVAPGQAASQETQPTDQIRSLQQQVAQLREANQQLQSLRGEVAQLRAGQDSHWLNERRAEEVKSLIREVLADAETRASLKGDAITAGYDGKKFVLASEDGSFKMNIVGQIQIRYLANFRDNTGSTNADGELAAPAGDDFKSGFEIRRTKLEFAGHIGDPKISYAIQLAVSRTSNSVSADKITIGYKLADNVKIWAGEDKAPFMREELTSSKRQLAVERSVFNEEFTLDKVQGLGLKIKAGDAIKIHTMINDGYHSGDGGTSVFLTQEDNDGVNTGTRSTTKRHFEDATDIAFTTRIDAKLAGDWKQMKDFTSWAGEAFAAFIGAAFHYEIGETGDSFANNNFWAWTVDGSIEVNGFNFFAAAAGQHAELDDSITAEEFDRIGFLVQGGFNIPLNAGNSIEPFARFEWIDYDGTADTDDPGRDDKLSMITFGANYYMKKHKAKFTLDVVVALDNVRSRHTGLGVLRDAPGEDGQVVVRSQFQLVF